MSDGFRAGFHSRHDAVSAAIGAAFALPRGFESVDLRASPGGAQSFVPQGEAGPRHFTPLDPDSNPTAGWDPFDAAASTPEGAGFVDPIAAAHAAGYAEGVAAAMAEAAAENGRNHGFAAALAEALDKGIGFDRERVARQLRQTVMLLVGRLVGDVGISADLLTARIERAVDCLADSTESAILRVHPDDVSLLDGRLPKTLFAIGDGAIARGSFLLESASTVVEDGPDQWLAQLSTVIEQVAVPSC